MHANWYVRFVHNYLPSPFSIATILMVLAFAICLIFTLSGPMEVLGYWYEGFWELLAFSMQMVLILVLGHALALTPAAQRAIRLLTGYASSSGRAAALAGFAAMFVGFINWGLCLIFGAILARKIGERAKAEGISINYPLVAAAGYSGMMVWHGGFSGSAPLVVAEEEHFLAALIGQIPISETLLSPLNMVAFLLLLSLIPAVLYWVGKKSGPGQFPEFSGEDSGNISFSAHTPAEKVDQQPYLAWLLGGAILILTFYTAWSAEGRNPLGFLDLNFINFLLFGLGLLLHGSVARFLWAVQEAVAGASGIIIQFPLYAGIMGIMKYSGLITAFSGIFVSFSTPDTLPIFTFFSAGLVNIFVPSGGGQWAVQGPVVVQAADALGVPASKVIMALAYGDGLTNMLQPFWALPLLGFTRLDARDILPYSSLIMLLGGSIYLLCLWLF
ncbi:short-chain fatty acid transporter [Nafulsella turpanensis]|uniref:short-chain fatty acid transporter n=1 Tax=Nafulsella turpanensis TaxID=1265690 RepID=UPI00034901F0|nr:TIGR00366 family protein [Nafulsella turpanensis]